MAFKSKVQPNIGLSGSPTTVTDTISSGYFQTVIGFSLSNTSANNVTVSAKLNKANTSTSAYFINNATILPGGALIIVGGDQKVVLESGDTITAWSSASNSVDTIISYLTDANS